MSPSNKLRVVLLGLTVLAFTGCATMQPTSFRVGEQRRPAKPANAVVLLFKDTEPIRKYEVVARLNVHLEKTFFIPSVFDEAKPQLEAMARQHGADAIIHVDETKSRHLETFIFNVTATAVVFTD